MLNLTDHVIESGAWALTPPPLKLRPYEEWRGGAARPGRPTEVFRSTRPMKAWERRLPTASNPHDFMGWPPTDDAPRSRSSPPSRLRPQSRFLLGSDQWGQWSAFEAAAFVPRSDHHGVAAGAAPHRLGPRAPQAWQRSPSASASICFSRQSQNSPNAGLQRKHSRPAQAGRALQ